MNSYSKAVVFLIENAGDRQFSMVEVQLWQIAFYILTIYK